jgi:Nucleotidyl transferase AbiEii toxin, Type IV TA system
MSNKVSSLKSSIEQFSRRQGIDAEMDQNLVKEAIHLHLLSAMSDAGILRHAAFQGGTALRLCYGGDRYSEDLVFVCGKAGSYRSPSYIEPAANFVRRPSYRTLSTITWRNAQKLGLRGRAASRTSTYPKVA